MVSGEPEGSVLGAAAFVYHTLGIIDSYSYLLDKSPVIKKIQPKAKNHEYYRSQVDRFMHLYWKFHEEFDDA